MRLKVQKKNTKIFDNMRRIKDDKVKDPFEDTLRSSNEVESKKKLKYLNVRRIKDDKVKDPFQDMLRRINEVQSK